MTRSPMHQRGWQNRGLEVIGIINEPTAFRWLMAWTSVKMKSSQS
jgi:hypothetical protein